MVVGFLIDYLVCLVFAGFWVWFADLFVGCAGLFACVCGLCCACFPCSLLLMFWRLWLWLADVWCGLTYGRG